MELRIILIYVICPLKIYTIYMWVFFRGGGALLHFAGLNDVISFLRSERREQVDFVTSISNAPSIFPADQSDYRICKKINGIA